jgi:predicted MFS family arabinose efflux permease
MALLAQLSFGVGIMLLWSFAGQLGAAHGFRASAVAQVLSASLFASIAGSLVAALIGTRRWSRWVMILGTVLIVTATALAAISSRFAVFVITLMAFGFCWNLLPPFQLGIASRLDFTGRLVVLSIAAVKLGYAIGTAACGFISTRISFQGAAAVAGVCFTFSLMLFRSASRGVHA